MNGAQDLGGMHGFGPIGPEPDEPVFHAEWERRVFAVTLAMGFTGQWNIDAARHARESLEPADYLASSYYQIWLAGLQKLLVHTDLATRREIVAGTSSEPAAELKRVLGASEVATALGKGGPSEREASSDPAFAIGDKVRARNLNPPGHTRLPRYARGRAGTISRAHGCHVFPDTNARGDGEQPQWLYSVKFSASELWGDASPAPDEVFIDLWESYLEPA